MHRTEFRLLTVHLIDEYHTHKASEDKTFYVVVVEGSFAEVGQLMGLSLSWTDRPPPKKMKVALNHCADVSDDSKQKKKQCQIRHWNRK